MQLSDKAFRVIKAEGISADELRLMLDKAAFTKLRGCNRRYFQWLFVVQDNWLRDMQRVDVVQIGKGHDRMLEEHEDCDGDGCRDCGWVGQVSRAIVDSTAAAMQHAH
jgi:hypothetical protein